MNISARTVSSFKPVLLRRTWRFKFKEGGRHGASFFKLETPSIDVVEGGLKLETSEARL